MLFQMDLRLRVDDKFVNDAFISKYLIRLKYSRRPYHDIDLILKFLKETNHDGKNIQIVNRKNSIIFDVK